MSDEIEIKIENDGKCRHDSFEASAEFTLSDWVTGDGGYLVSGELRGWGATEEEARANFKVVIGNMRRALSEHGASIESQAIKDESS